MRRRSLALRACECQYWVYPARFQERVKELFLRGERDLVVGAELVIAEDVLGGQRLIRAVGIAARHILEAIGIVAASPAIIVAHVGAQTYLVPDGNSSGIGVQGTLAVIRIDIRTIAVTIEDIAERFAVGADAGTDRGAVFQHAHRVAGRRQQVDFDIFLAGLEVFLPYFFRDAALPGGGAGGDAPVSRKLTASLPVKMPPAGITGISSFSAWR